MSANWTPSEVGKWLKGLSKKILKGSDPFKIEIERYVERFERPLSLKGFESFDEIKNTESEKLSSTDKKSDLKLIKLQLIRSQVSISQN